MEKRGLYGAQSRLMQPTSMFCGFEGGFEKKENGVKVVDGVRGQASHQTKSMCFDSDESVENQKKVKKAARSCSSSPTKAPDVNKKTGMQQQ